MLTMTRHDVANDLLERQGLVQFGAGTKVPMAAGALHSMSRLVCASIGIAMGGLGLGVTARQAAAQIAVYDPANYAENVLHYVNQLTQIKNQLDQVKYQLRALAKLPSAPWRSVSQSLANIGGLMSVPRSLGYAAPGVGTTFRGYYPVTPPVGDWPTEQRAQSKAAVDVFGAAINATAQQQTTVAAGRASIQRMKQLNGAVNGHEQVLELENAATVFTAEELMLLRQAVMAQTNIQAVYFADRINEEAQRDAAARAVLAQLAVAQTASPNQSLRITP
jgi:P-type conjugative transfer protein TrbJ